MPSDLDEAFGPELARRVANASAPTRAAIATAVADRAIERVGLTVTLDPQVVSELDDRYFDLREAGDPSWEAAFMQARAAAAWVAGSRGDVGEAAYEALHAGVDQAELAAIAERAL